MADLSHTVDLVQLFEAVVAEAPDRSALEGPGWEVRYAELDAMADALTGALSATGLRPGDLIAIVTDDRRDLVVALLACLKGGFVFVPLGTAEPEARLRAMVRHAQPAGGIIEASHRARLQASLELPQDRLLTLEAGRLGAGHAREPASPQPAPPRSGDDPCYVYHTSGSTGRPKAILGSREAVRHFIAWELATFAPAPVRVSQLAAPTFDVFLRDVLVALCSGGTLCVPPPRDELLGPGALGAWLAAARVELVHCVTPLLRALVAQRPELPWLKHVLVSGEALHPADVKHWFEVFGDRVALINLYGASETTMVKFAHRVRAGDAERALVPIGRPISGTEAAVLDARGRVCAPGMIGEIYVRTPFRLLGYLRDPERTAATFVTYPPSRDPAVLCHRTGDFARIDDRGDFFYVGRKDNQVKIRGVRVELAEVEGTVLLHEAVEEAAVVDWEERPNDRSLVAYVVPKPGQALSAADVRAFVATRLPDVFVPSFVVMMERLPRTMSGKTDRKALPSPARDEKQQLEPLTETERMLAQLFAQVLGVPRIGRAESFFTLGGHSLLATQLLARVREVTGTEIPLRGLFQTPTVAGLAGLLESARHGGAAPARLPIERREATAGPAPLSHGQRALWFLHKVVPSSPFYNLSGQVRLRGELRVDLLERAFTEILQRHEILRTTFTEVDGEPVQRVAPPPEVSLSPLVLDGTSPAERERACEAHLRRAREAPFDLSVGPLVRIELLRVDPVDHLLVITLHHAIADAQSYGILVRELEALYRALVVGDRPRLPALSIQYGDFARWQQAWPVPQAAAAYWKHQLAGAPPLLALPTDRPRPRVQRFRGASLPFAIGRELTDGMAVLCRDRGLTPFMVLLGTFQLLLSRYTGQDDICVGTSVADRPVTELEPLVGYFLNTLPLRTSLAGVPSFAELLGRVRDVVLDGLANRALPFDKIVELVHPPRDPGYHPIFQVMLISEPRTPSLTLPGLSVEMQPNVPDTSRFDLTLLVEATPEGMTGRIEYDTALFDAATVERMLDHFHHLLQAGIDDPSARVSELPLLSAAARTRQLVAWNATAVERPPASLLAGIEARVAQDPGAVAAVFEDRMITYGQLDRRANQLARHLRGLGVGPEALVAICIERSIEMLIGLLGIWKAGGAYVPLDPGYPAERLALMLEDSGATVVLTQDTLAGGLPAHAAQVVRVDRDWDDVIARQAEAPLACGATGEHLAYVIYTSGSTGRPKGVQVTHRSVANLMAFMREHIGLSAQDRWLAVTSLSFDIAGLELFLPLLCGATVQIASREAAQDGRRLIAALSRSRATVMQATPSTWRMLLEAGWEGRGLQVLCGGEALPQGLAAALIERGGPVVNLYGPTETTIWSAIQPVRSAERPIPIGRPIANTQLYVLDRALEPVPEGVTGELYIAGAGVARGYLRDAGLTAERFVPDPFAREPGARMYRTGDLARYLADGVVEFLGRTDHQVKLRGHRIELPEIEAVLAGHPDVREAVVSLLDPGGAGPQLVGYVTGRPETVLTAAVLKAWLADRLPSYMVPPQILVLERFPRTPNGKLDRKALPSPNAGAGYPRSEPPRTALEASIASIWCEVLGIEQVGRDDNFFERGGHSLLVPRVQLRLEQLTGRAVPMVALFAHPTIRALATYLAADTGTTSAADDRLEDEIGKQEQSMRKLSRLRKKVET